MAIAGFQPPERVLNIFNVGDLPIHVVPTIDESQVVLVGITGGLKASIEKAENRNVEHFTIFGTATDKRQWPAGARPYVEVQINSADELSLTAPTAAVIDRNINATIRIALVEGSHVEVKQPLGRIAFTAQMTGNPNDPKSGEIEIAGRTYLPSSVVPEIWEDYGFDVFSIDLELDEHLRLSAVACNGHELTEIIRVEPTTFRDVDFGGLA